MAEGYSVKINRRDGALEITGDDKDWVDAKLKELAPVWSQAVADPADGGGGSSAATRRRPVRARKPSDTPQANGEGAGRRRRAGGGGDRVSKNDELVGQLTPDVRDQLAEYVAERQAAFAKTQPQAAAVIATFLADHLSRPTMTASELYTVYVTMGWRAPNKPRVALHHSQWRNNFFNSASGEYTLTHKGENYGRHDSLNTASE